MAKLPPESSSTKEPKGGGLKPKGKDAGKKEKPHDGGWRETIESLAMAVILALLFKGYVAEAFVIPTGSMAPTLQGRHRDICCPQCNYWYQATASDEVDSSGVLTGQVVISATCPVCRYTHTLDPIEKPNEDSFSGDRIIVSKFAYEIGEPKRWDVIVFKYPGGATQNFIKRLVGLPGEVLRISGGNVYTRKPNEPDSAFRIARKPPHKLTAMLQIVDDSDHIPAILKEKNWPPRWQETTSPANPNPAWKTEDGGSSFVCEQVPDGMAWLRYRHRAPTYEDWETLTLEGKLPDDIHQRRGRLITDMYAYNTSIYVSTRDGVLVPGDYSIWTRHPPVVPERLKSPDGRHVRYNPQAVGPGVPCSDEDMGTHWVDDIAVECLAEILDGQGNFALDLVRGGVHYRCTIDVQSGKAVLSRTNAAGNALPFRSTDGAEIANPTAMTSVKGAGTYRLRLTNCDHEVMLFVNGRAVPFDQPAFYESDEIVVPQWTEQDGLDLEPAGIGISGLRVKVSKLRIFRDKYYIANTNGNDYVTAPQQTLNTVLATPELWQSSRLFDPENRYAEEYEIGPDEFFPMGDNSPQSLDGRYWPEDDTLHRDLLIGKALMIYWPHAWNRPIPYLPNIGRMGLIR
jgi:signal peptidase I